MADTTIKTFDDITDRLDEIVAAVRSKTPLLSAASICSTGLSAPAVAPTVDMVDQFDLSPREAASSRFGPTRQQRSER